MSLILNVGYLLPKVGLYFLPPFLVFISLLIETSYILGNPSFAGKLPPIYFQLTEPVLGAGITATQ